MTFDLLVPEKVSGTFLIRNLKGKDSIEFSHSRILLIGLKGLQFPAAS